MASHDEPIAYRQGSTIAFRASSFGGCVRSLAASLSGITAAPPPAVLMKAFQAGHDAEDAILAAVEDEYQLPVDDRQITVEYRDGDYVWRGHPDGTVQTSDMLFVVDAKNLGKSYFRSFMNGGMGNLGSLGKKYASQALIYCYAIEADAFILAVRSKEEGTVVTEEYSIERLKELSGLSKRKMRKKAQLIEAAAANADILNAPCEEEVFGCGFFFLHSGDMGEGLFLDGEDISPVDEEVVNGLTNARQAANRSYKEAEAAKKATDTALRNWIDRQKPPPEALDGTDENKKEVSFSHVTVDGVRITRMRGKSTRLNQAAMTEAGIDLSPYKEETYNIQIRVTEPKGDGDDE